MWCGGIAPKKKCEITERLYSEYLIWRNDLMMSKEPPRFYINKENCCGCTACYAICPVYAISMKTDEEGFLYPIVDAEKCLRCYKCITVCAFKNDQETRGYLARGGTL